MMFYRNEFVNSPEKVTDIDRNEYKRQFFMASLAMQLEQDLGYPIDMEFAISQKGEINILQQEKILLKTHRNNYYYLDMQKDAISVFITIYKKTDGSKYDKEVERATFCLPSDRYQYITKEFIDNYIEIDKTISRVRQLKNEYGMYFKIV